MGHPKIHDVKPYLAGSTADGRLRSRSSVIDTQRRSLLYRYCPRYLTLANSKNA